MPFKKGQSGNPAGRKKGSKDKKTEQWERLGRQLTEESTEKVSEIMKALAKEDPDKFMNYYFQLIEYFKPRQSRVEQKTELDLSEKIIKVVYENINGKGNNGKAT